MCVCLSHVLHGLIFIVIFVNKQTKQYLFSSHRLFNMGNYAKKRKRKKWENKIINSIVQQK